ncbi:MAG: FecR domain-containing protein [Bacteroidota bacterium]|nr:FecR domain-containing protein [Bacteroidota bacterium]
MINNNNIDQLISRVLSNKATQEEKDLFDKWLKADSAHLSEFAKLKSYWNSRVDYTCETPVDEAFERFKNNRLRNEEKHDKPKKQPYFLWGFVSMAAAIALLLVIAGKLFMPAQLEKYSFSTQNQRDTLYLPDSTMVVLNKFSRMEYTSNYNKKERHIKFVGEGYFDVRRNPASPFVVEMGKSRITVLGTAFNIRAYRQEDFIRTTLIRGAIRFNIDHEDDDQVTLRPNQELYYNKKNQEISLKCVDASFALLWMKNVYRYDAASLQYLLNDIGTIYGKKICITNQELANTIISGSFHEKQSLNEILTIISRSVPIKWSMEHNDTILIDYN